MVTNPKQPGLPPFAEAPRPRPGPAARRSHTRLAAALAYSLPAAALAAAGAGLYRRLHRSLPPLDGTFFCPVTAPVRVVRDAWGIPHIHAQNAADLFTAQGYAQAQDRLWQMDLQRRVGAGRLSEIFGPITLASDILLRRFGIGQAAAAEAAGLNDVPATAAAAYCRGVNAYMAWAREQRALPAEFAILAYEPEPWTVADCLIWSKVLAWGLGGNWESELVRARLVNYLGATRAAALEPDYPPGQPLTAEPGVAFSGLDDLFASLLDEYEDLVQTTGLGGMMQSAMPASNNWVVAPTHSASGRALLANDPHLPLYSPSVWHLVHLSGGGYEVAGAAIPGAPGVCIGHNADIAWGTTNAMVDAQDLYVEQLHPDDPTQVRYEDGWERGTVRTERIAVRGRPRPVVDRILITRHGPVITGEWSPETGKWLHAGAQLLNLPQRRPLPKDPAPAGGTRPPTALALRWAALTPTRSLEGMLDFNRAHDWPSFLAGVEKWEAPAVNMVYADRAGNIGYHLVGWVPIRARGQGVLPVPGWTGRYEWQGYIPFAELPHSYNPAAGYIVTANNRIAGPAYPYFLGREWATGYRARRIADLLAAKPQITLDDCATIQSDIYTIPGHLLSQILVERLAARPAVPGRREAARREALGYLAAWDGRMDRDSVAASIYEVTSHFLARHVYGLAFADKSVLDQYLGSATQSVTRSTTYIARAIPQLLRALQANDVGWLRGLAADPAAAPGLDWETLLARSLDDGLRLLRRRLGRDMARWRWGRLHRVTLVHPLGMLGPLARIFNPPAVAMGGDRDTVCMTAELPDSPVAAGGNGVSYRQLFDLGAWDSAQIILAGGQAGQPLSPHYSDQVPLWQNGQYIPLPFSAPAVAASAAHELVLRAER